MSLDTRLRNAARQVKGITIWRTHHGQWQASMTFDATGWVTETDADLPTALARLLARYDRAESLPDLLERAALQRHRMTNILEKTTCG